VRVATGEAHRAVLPLGAPPGSARRVHTAAALQGHLPRPPSGRNLEIASDDDGYQKIPHYQRLGQATDPAYFIDRYDEEILYVDHGVGEILRTLDALSLADRTIVVLTADHGEAMGEDDYYFCHGFTLGLDQLHVPMIWRVPGWQPRRVRDIVSLIDVMPTLLELTGLREPADMQGESLVGVAEGVPRSRERVLYAESLNQEALIRAPFIYYRDRSDIGDQHRHRVSHGEIRKLGPRWKLLPGAAPAEPPLEEFDRALEQYGKLRKDSRRRMNDTGASEQLLRDLRALGYAAPGS
jgi:hypothetical protein